MTRRDILAGAAAILATSAIAKNVAPLIRGLWCDKMGAFAIGAFPEFGIGQFAFDYAALRVGRLKQLSSRDWQMTGALDGSGGGVAKISLEGQALRIGDRRLQPVPIKRMKFDATSGFIQISAELAVPAGKHPRGTILMIYGSGPAPKEAFDPWAFWFLASGFAVITYDKRGSGRSGGDWRLTGLEDLAADARHVLERARALGAKGPIFAWGASQAGWIHPQLGAASVVDGIIMHAGATTRPRDQIIGSIEAELRAYAFPDEEIDRAKAYYALDTDVSCGTRPWADIDAAFKQASARGSEWLLAPPTPSDALERTMIKLMADFDPAPYWRKCKVPTLALFGGKDWIVPAKANLSALQSSISTDAVLTSMTLPSANHLMFVAEKGVRTEYPSLSRIDPGYFSEIAHWLERRLSGHTI